ncbi:hypothetical protein DLP05_113 [Stenotrophomonas phage vB_SmaS_DLP_5]|uniref:Uncharacterized protein n=1 Tax=Stenotrophomonas phage vB_SmaS_DLP_5 TaxID=2044561 RepID=A0A2D2W2I8_9CAUD|nr:hypothetical protein FDJ07_gp108 [Stenotrophomonas phage vB_SmaS_DLP_5]ATS92355.1 hypothetical protein DLP05_113 [Stenotrophomonas phage vB_SmaS_DLP_5]
MPQHWHLVDVEYHDIFRNPALSETYKIKAGSLVQCLLMAQLNETEKGFYQLVWFRAVEDFTQYGIWKGELLTKPVRPLVMLEEGIRVKLRYDYVTDFKVPGEEQTYWQKKGMKDAFKFALPPCPEHQKLT